MCGSIPPVTIIRGHTPRDLSFFFLIWQAYSPSQAWKQDNSLPPGLTSTSTLSIYAIKSLVAILVAVQLWQTFCREHNAFLEFIERRILD